MATERTSRRRSRRRTDRKDRLIQTRVAGDLEKALKKEAARRRLTVSHLIRNTLEDTFNLVEGVTSDVEQLVSGSVELAQAVSRDAKRLADFVRGRPGSEGNEPSEPSAADHGEFAGEAANESVPAGASAGEADVVTPVPESPPSNSNDGSEPNLEHVYGWNEVIANRAVACVRCGENIERGDEALVGLSDDPTKPRAWLCLDCNEEMFE